MSLEKLSIRITCRFEAQEGPVTKTGWRAVFHPPVVRNSIYTSLLVGTVLVLINHGGSILSGRWPVIQILLTYCVPFLVTTYGAVSVARVSGQRTADGARQICLSKR